MTQPATNARERYFAQLSFARKDRKFLERQFTRQSKVDYLKIKTLRATAWKTTKRNVPLLRPDENLCLDIGAGGNAFGWKYARWLEKRESASLQEGCYGISQKRAERHVGMLGKNYFGDSEEIRDVSEQSIRTAKQFRLFGYFPVDDIESFIELQSIGGVGECAVRITSDWYDPPIGRIPMPTDESIFCGTHSFTPLVDESKNRILFANSWGIDWGDEGHGEFSLEYFRQYATELIAHAGFMDYLPFVHDEDICVGWKWNLSEKFSFHCREIIQGGTGDRIAWSFGSRRGNELVIHELFVWPTFRGQGLGRKLVELMTELCSQANLKPRIRVPFVDAQTDNLACVMAVARMMGTELSESNSAFYSLDGIFKGGKVGTPICISRVAPPPAASPLEWIRRGREMPVVEAVRVPVLFGTNRKPQINEDRISFTGERGVELVCGVQSINIENVQRFGSAGRNWLEFAVEMYDRFQGLMQGQGKNETSPAILRNDGFLSLSKFLCIEAEDRHHLVYVHGFNTSFDFAISQAARLKADLKLKGNIYLYSWPSAAQLAAYSSDEAAIEASYPFFLQFMQNVREATQGEPLSVIAHSMGNRILARWIEDSAERSIPIPMSNAIFAAPDVDHDVFRYAVSNHQRIFERATLYANSADIALQLSEIKHGFARAGLIPPLVDVPGLDTVLVQGFDLFDLAHGYFSEAGNALHDIFVLLKFSSPVNERPGTRLCRLNDTQSCWSISHS